ncbi:MAG TPA: DASS family sodium-coupled anion symporter [Gemmatimonadaceae bacterium]|nr:DASS family sodium-coupled anion symporter [Gemmatimonadaceae bacterium]
MTVSTAPTSTPAAEVLLPRDLVIRWGFVILTVTGILLYPVPDGITPKSWRLLAIFLGTIVGSIVRPVAAGAMVFLGVAAVALTGTLTPAQALGGYADPIVWLVLCAFFISRGVVKTGLGRRIALVFIRAIGHRSIGLAYALVGTDMLLASLVPSNGARAGGVVFPVAKSLAEAYESTPGPTRRRLGAYLMATVYQCDVIACAMFLTGQASNVLIAKFAKDVANVDLSYARWFVGGVVPGLLSLILVPMLLYRLYPPEVKHTPGAAAFASEELQRIGGMTAGERIMLLVFGLIAGLWMSTSWHGINYAVVALGGICALLLTNVLTWDDVISERSAWDVYIWYGGLVQMAAALGETGITKKFAESAAGFTTGWAWGAALAVLLLVYFYAHYGFASITAHATAMYTPFLVVTIAAGAPPVLAALTLAYFSNLDASLTHFGTTPAPIYFGSRYVTQREWWKYGFIVSLATIAIWSTVGVGWWKLLGWW